LFFTKYFFKTGVRFLWSFMFVLILFLASCSIDKMIMEKLADSLSSGMGTAFTGENDPELVGDALPFALKLYDSLLEQNPQHQGLLLATGSTYIMYAHAYVELPALTLPKTEIQRKLVMRMRAKRLYLRGRDLVLKALDLRYPDFLAELAKPEFKAVFKKFKKEDVPCLYWAAAGWMAAFALDTFDMELSVTKDRAVALMQKVLELDEEYNMGAGHDFFIAFYGAQVSSIKNAEETARQHFKRALEISKGLNPSPYVSLATTLCIQKQTAAEFLELLDKALAINPDKNPQNRLAIIITQKKAYWYKEHIQDFFYNVSP
jgi:predicted anti-sigma-YlaC factor YlaD